MEKNFTYLIVGGGIAGTVAAETIRQNDTAATVAIVSDEPYRLYSRIMLSKPNFFLGKTPFDQVWLKTEEWYAKNNIELFTGRRAMRLDPASKFIMLDNGDIFHYEKLLLAIGGYARAWGIGGSEKRGIFYLRTLDDAKTIIASIKTSKQAVCIGGGFVSFEMCDMLRLAGIDVTLVLRESYYWEPLLDAISGHMIETALEHGGVKILRNSEVKEVVGKDVIESVVVGDGTQTPCQMIIVGIGVFCPFGWLVQAGIGVNRGILADEYLATNIPDIWVAGDCAEFNDLILGEKIQLGNWVNSQMQGRIAALNMLGKKTPFRMVSFYTTQGFDITIAFVGDVRPGADRNIFSRGSAQSGSYGRIIAKDGEMIGATLINRTNELAAIAKLIEKDVTIIGHENDIGDSNFDLKTLIR